MPTITTQPTAPSNLFRAYQPLIFQLTATTIYGQPPIIKAQLFINGLAFGNLDTKPHLTESVGVFSFEFDPAPLLQEFFENESTFGGYGSTAAALSVPAASNYNTQYMQRCEWYMNFQTWEASGLNGEYEGAASTASTTNYAFNAQANQDSVQSLNPHIVLPLKFLTNSSRKRVICLEDSVFLSFWNTGLGRDLAIRVRTYNSSNTLQQTGYIKIGNLTAELRTERIKVGAANINATLAASWEGSATAYITSTIAYYIIDLWDTTLSLSQSESFTFYVIVGCCDSDMIYFINEFGADDFVRGYRPVKSIRPSEGQYEKVLRQFPNPSLRGITTLQKTGERKIDLFVRPEWFRYLEWLKELAISPNVFLLEEGSIIPIAVTLDNSSDILLENKKQNVQEVSMTFSFANKDFSQRN